MPVIAVLGICFQIFFAVHAVRTGRDRFWIYVIIFFPGIGCMIYFLSEYLPSLLGDRGVKKTVSDIGHTLNPGKRLRRLQQQVELTPSVKNKKALAEAYVNHGLFDDAIDLYKSCQQGAHADDNHLVEGLACAYFFKGRYDQARHLLEQVVAHPETAQRDRFRLLLAQTHDALGDGAAAEELYTDVVRTFSGEEARCRYALFLKKQGRTDAANRLFNDILKNVKLSPKYYKRTQKTWLNMAKAEKL